MKDYLGPLCWLFREHFWQKEFLPATSQGSGSRSERDLERHAVLLGWNGSYREP